MLQEKLSGLAILLIENKILQKLNTKTQLVVILHLKSIKNIFLNEKNIKIILLIFRNKRRFHLTCRLTSQNALSWPQLFTIILACTKGIEPVFVEHIYFSYLNSKILQKILYKKKNTKVIETLQIQASQPPKNFHPKAFEYKEHKEH